MPIERDRPRAHLVVDDFFEPGALATIVRELPGFVRQMKPGLVRSVGHDGQSVFFEHARRKNRAVWIHEPAKTLRLFREQLWSEPMLQVFDTAREPLFQIIPSCWAPHLQVSSYMTGDHYAFHEDEGAGVNLTAIVFLGRAPEKIRGGDLVLAYAGDETKVRFRHNRLVVFPSRTLHRVTRVHVDSDDPLDARISLQCWLTHGRPPAKPKPRAPEADRPTFLVAEDAIIAAAQAMIASSATSEQTPEDLYWGAFYVSRILTSNLRVLTAATGGDLTIGRIRIRRHGRLEVYARGRLHDRPVRFGFSLRGPDAPEGEALELFVEAAARGTTARSDVRATVPPGAEEEETFDLFHRLLGRTRER